MSLSRLLHDLIDHAVPQGNARGDMHARVDALDDVDDVPAEDTPAETPAETPAAPAAKFATPKVNGTAGA